MMDWLKKYWFIVIAVVSLSTAWGESRMTIVNQSEKIKTLEEIARANDDTKVKVERLDERTLEMQRTQEKMLDILLNMNRTQKVK